MKLATYTSILGKGAFCRQARGILAMASVSLMSLCLALAIPLGAQDRDDSSVELELAVVSNYVWRGDNIFQEKAAQDGKPASTDSSGAPAFQPSITFYPGAEGWYFNIWASYAISARKDKDTNKDGVIELVDADGKDPCGDDYAGATTCETNGLRHADEIDYTLGYEKESRIGTVGFGLLNYSYSNHLHRDHSDTEIFFAYSPQGEVLSGLYLNLYSGLRSTNDYYQLGYGYELEMSGDTSLSFDIAAGYAIQKNKEGLKDYTGSVGLSTYGIDISLNFAMRVRSEFYDDGEGDAKPHDFKTFDSDTGEYHDIPKMLQWLYVGYTQEF